MQTDLLDAIFEEHQRLQTLEALMKQKWLQGTDTIYYHGWPNWRASEGTRYDVRGILEDHVKANMIVTGSHGCRYTQVHVLVRLIVHENCWFCGSCPKIFGGLIITWENGTFLLAKPTWVPFSTDKLVFHHLYVPPSMSGVAFQFAWLHLVVMLCSDAPCIDAVHENTKNNGNKATTNWQM